MERSKQNLQDDGHEVDGVVVHLVAIFSIPTLLELNLEAQIDGKKELGVELFIKALTCFESRSVAVNHRLEGAEALGADAEFPKENVVGDSEHSELLGHILEIHRCVNFLFICGPYLIHRHSFPLHQNQLQR